jgi:hypothetical protein
VEPIVVLERNTALEIDMLQEFHIFWHMLDIKVANHTFCKILTSDISFLVLFKASVLVFVYIFEEFFSFIKKLMHSNGFGLFIENIIYAILSNFIQL